MPKNLTKSRLPILVIVNQASRFGFYLVEILKTEGFNLVEVRRLSHVDAAVLRLFDVVILTETSLTKSQITIFEDHVSGGGGLIAIRPPRKLAGVFGLTSADGVTSEGYVQFDTANAIGRGLVTETIQYHGDADHYADIDSTVMATLYQDSATATAFPAIALKGRAIIFTNNLAKSIAFTRQGNPDRADGEGDGWRGIRASDAFGSLLAADPFVWLDFSKAAIPQADIQQRALANAIHTVGRIPLPRFWYFPKKKKSVLVMTGDQDGGKVEPDALSERGTLYDELLAVESAGGHLTYYLVVGPGGTAVAPGRIDWTVYRDRELDWRLRGHSTGLHLEHGDPLGDHSCGVVPLSSDALSARVQSHIQDFQGVFGHSSRTLRTACLEWKGWVEQARVLAANGVRMNLDCVSMTFKAIPNGQTTANSMPYKAGSGLPIKFVDEQGRMLDIYQQPAQFEDDVVLDLYNSPLGVGTHTDFATNLVTGTLDDSVRRFHGAVTLNVHPTGYASFSGEWARNVLAHARRIGVPILSADEWLDYWDARHETGFRNITFSGSTLLFTVDVPSTVSGLTVKLPFVHNGRSVVAITRDNVPYPYTLAIVGGTSFALLEAREGAHRFRVSYRQATHQIADFVRSGGTPGTQWSPQLDYEVTVTTAGVLRVQYEIAPSHTGNIDLIVMADGQEVARIGPLGPPELAENNGTDFLDVGSGPGSHTITLRPVGVLGGSNSGTLSSWGRRVTVQNS